MKGHIYTVTWVAYGYPMDSTHPVPHTGTFEVEAGSDMEAIEKATPIAKTKSWDVEHLDLQITRNVRVY